MDILSETRKEMEAYEAAERLAAELKDKRIVQVNLGDLWRVVERARWSPEMMNTLTAEEYGRTLEAEVRLRQVIMREMCDLGRAEI